jgi:hypothetical protein
MGAAVLENTHFTKAVALAMLKWVRFLTFVYVVLWLIALMNRTTDLGWLAVAAQALFSEQLLSRWLRLEWLRSRTEEIYNGLLTAFVATLSPDDMHPFVLDAFVAYETTKANAGIVTSEKIFERLNTSLSTEWEQIKRSANIS